MSLFLCLVSVVTENSVCFLGDCAPGGVAYSVDSENSPAACGASCAGDYPTCTAWVTATISTAHFYYRYSACPVQAILDHVVASNKRIYACYHSKFPSLVQCTVVHEPVEYSVFGPSFLRVRLSSKVTFKLS